MADNLKGKKVPWSQFQDYLKTHQRTIVTFQDLLKSEVMEIPEIETKLPNSFSQLYSAIGKILKDNNILPD
jgi:hypothetical protein